MYAKKEHMYLSVPCALKHAKVSVGQKWSPCTFGQLEVDFQVFHMKKGIVMTIWIHPV